MARASAPIIPLGGAQPESAGDREPIGGPPHEPDPEPTRAYGGRRLWLERVGGIAALLLGGSAGSGIANPRRAHAGPFDDELLQIDLPQLQYAGTWNPRPDVMRELGIELRLRSRLEPVREPSIVSADDESVFLTPFLYIAGQGGFPALGDDAEHRLQRFVDLGGLLVFDDANGGLDRGFVEDVREFVSRILPGRELRPIAREHVLYHSFYLIDAPAGRTRMVDHNLGVQEEGRLKVVVLPNDLGGALARGKDGSHVHSCSPGGSVQREWAIRLAVNLLLYATCTDYKSDRAHVETLLRRSERPF